MLEILEEQGRSGVVKKRNRDDQTGRSFTEGPVRSALVRTNMIKLSKIHILDLDNLEHLGLKPGFFEGILRKAKVEEARKYLSPTLGEIKTDSYQSRVAQSLQDSLNREGESGTSFKVIYYSDKSEKLSASLDLADTLTVEQKSKIEMLKSLLLILGSPILSEIYENPNEISKTWLRQTSLASFDPVSSEQIAQQIAKQEAYLSEKDKKLEVSERSKRWEIAKRKLLAIYHSPFIREAELERVAFEKAVSRKSVAEYFTDQKELLPDLIDGDFELAKGFGKPRLQGSTNACLSFAILDSMEFLGAPRLSVGFSHSIAAAYKLLAGKKHLFGLLKQNAKTLTNKSDDDVVKRLDQGVESDVMSKVVLAEGLPLDEDFPFREKNWLVEKPNAIPGRVYQLDGFRAEDASLSMEEVKNIIGRGHIIPIAIRHSSRSVLEDWIQPEPVSNDSHALIIIGFGFGSSPFDSAREEAIGKDYLIVRDSFGDREIHYKVASDELLPLIEQVFVLGNEIQKDKELIYPELEATAKDRSL